MSTGTGHGIFYNQGESSVQRLGPTRYMTRMEGVPARAMEPLLHGFACGFLISLTGIRPTVTFECVNIHTVEYVIDWSQD